MPTDLNESLHNAAAKPSREAPLSAIETRLRRRRRLRQGAVGVCALALVAALGGGIALTTGGGPSVRTVTPAAAPTVTEYGGDPPISVELPDGWIESPIGPGLRFDQEVLTVGTATQPTGVAHTVCLADAAYQDDVFVLLREFTHVELLRQSLNPEEGISRLAQTPFPDRPADFATAPSDDSTCFPPGADVVSGGWPVAGFRFEDSGRMFEADIGFGPQSPPERRAEAYAVLNSLHVQPIVIALEPVTTVPPSTVPPSADTEAIAAAFELWLGTKPPGSAPAASVIEDYEGIRESIQIASDLVGNPQCYTGRVDAFLRIDEDDADVIYTFLCNGQPSIPNLSGRAVKIDGVWKVSRETVCSSLEIGGTYCPPRE